MKIQLTDDELNVITGSLMEEGDEDDVTQWLAANGRLKTALMSLLQEEYDFRRCYTCGNFAITYRFDDAGEISNDNGDKSLGEWICADCMTLPQLRKVVLWAM